MKNYIIYHDSCLDGFISGMIAFYKAMYLKVENVVVIPSNYSDKTVEAEDAASITLVDFSYPMDVLMNYVYKGIDVTVVDHHKTFIESFLKFDESIQHPSLLAKQWPKRDAEHYMTYHPVSGRPLFRNMEINPDENKFTNFSFFLNNNEVKDKNSEYVHSGASLCFQIATSESMGTAIKELLVEKTNGDIYETIRLARFHDLWLHKGDEKSDAYALSHWFKKFHKANRDFIEGMKKSPDKSAAIFEELLDAFNTTSLFDKIKDGEEDLAVLAEKLEALSKTDVVKEVKLNLHHPEGARICYVQGEDAKRLGISIVGSFMVTKKGWDVAIMDAVESDEKHVYSLRSNEQSSNVDVSAICQAFFKEGLALTGGGHTNAAGVGFEKDKKDTFFTIVEKEETFSEHFLHNFEITQTRDDCWTISTGNKFVDFKNVDQLIANALLIYLFAVKIPDLKVINGCVVTLKYLDPKPPEVIVINESKEFIENYPSTWRFYNARKNIHLESETEEVILRLDKDLIRGLTKLAEHRKTTVNDLISENLSVIYQNKLPNSTS